MTPKTPPRVLVPRSTAGPVTRSNPPPRTARPRLQVFTLGMLIAIVAIHAYVSSLNIPAQNIIYEDYALWPARFGRLHDFSPGALLTFVSHAFLHANWGHVLANCYALFLFGLLAERFLGTMRVVLVYFASAIAGGLLFVLLDPTAFVPLVGASGAISGLFGAAIVSAPAASRRALTINAVVWLGLNVGLPALNADVDGQRIAWEAHLGGFLIGLLLGWILRAAMPRLAEPAAPGAAPAGSSPASQAGAKKPEPFNPVQRR
jgi:membrane associated rhomboid family serine protease